MVFVDEARIFVKAGDGGKGCESFYLDRYMRHKRPDGGDGGSGGDVIIRADNRMYTLLDYRFKQHYKADKGGNASSKNKTGRGGKDCILRVPPGTIVKDHETGLVIRDLTEEGQSVVIAKGGLGGWGNGEHKYPKPPLPGEELTVKLELKVIADVGLVGFPNAGKSTLVQAVSKVKSKVANYPFTTKHPVLGVVFDEDGGHFVMADLPGLIEGAHQGKGLGHQFLKHAERTKILVHVIDMAGVDCRDPLEDYEKINHELDQYSELLAVKHRIVVANKMDLPDASVYLEMFREKYKVDIIPVSAHEQEGLKLLITKIQEILCQENSQDQ